MIPVITIFGIEITSYVLMAGIGIVAAGIFVFFDGIVGMQKAFTVCKGHTVKAEIA